VNRLNDVVLQVKELEAGYETRLGRVRAVDRVSFNLRRGEFLGLAGESGCGKSTLAFALMNLLKGRGKIFAGEIILEGQNLAYLPEEELRRIRWSKISMVFQSAMSALNPVLTIEEQLLDGIFAHRRGIPKRAARERVRELMELVDLPPDRLRDYPHQLSGGMRQRVMIAMALLLQPQVVIMDEPTTALDVVVQRTIMEKIEELRRRLGFAVIFITHDLSLLLEVADRIAVMYGGRLAEVAPARDLYARPHHPYTQGLLSSFPALLGEGKDYGGIPGKPPSLLNPEPGCLFYERCGQRMARCTRPIKLRHVAPDHQVACHLYAEEGSPDDRGAAAGA
jgi:peptide/nickel transport system ATP-binding protein